LYFNRSEHPLDKLGIISYNKIWLIAPASPASTLRAKLHQAFFWEAFSGLNLKNAKTNL
jgi:hypothetical protein